MKKACDTLPHEPHLLRNKIDGEPVSRGFGISTSRSSRTAQAHQAELWQQCRQNIIWHSPNDCGIFAEIVANGLFSQDQALASRDGDWPEQIS